MLAKTEDDTQLTACLDEVCPGLGTPHRASLFIASGSETPYLERVLDVLQLFHAEARRSTTVATRLKEMGLPVPKLINIERAGEGQRVGGLWTLARISHSRRVGVGPDAPGSDYFGR